MAFNKKICATCKHFGILVEDIIDGELEMDWCFYNYPHGGGGRVVPFWSCEDYEEREEDCNVQ